MTIYVVTTGSYSDYGIDAMFSTKEAAEAYIVEGSGYRYADYNSIDEWEVDEKAGFILRTYWLVSIEDNGNAPSSYSNKALASPNARSGDVGRCGDWGFRAKSFVSEEHAIKLAVEARQAWLREKAVPCG